VRGFRAVRELTDFLPGFGVFETPVYRLPIGVCGRAVELEFGVLPSLLALSLSLLAKDGWIIGTGLLRDRVTTIDLAGERIWIR
jgi:hypothetical protein